MIHREAIPSLYRSELVSASPLQVTVSLKVMPRRRRLACVARVERPHVVLPEGLEVAVASFTHVAVVAQVMAVAAGAEVPVGDDVLPSRRSRTHSPQVRALGLMAEMTAARRVPASRIEAVLGPGSLLHRPSHDSRALSWSPKVRAEKARYCLNSEGT